jgi:hypothetical protein
MTLNVLLQIRTGARRLSLARVPLASACIVVVMAVTGGFCLTKYTIGLKSKQCQEIG